MRRMICFLVVVGLLFSFSSGAMVMADYMENWDTNPPTNNDWYYYVEGQPNDGEVPMEWYGSGPAGGGYVQCPLGDLTQWDAIAGTANYWPLFTYDEDHSVDLNATPWVSICTRDSTEQISSELFSLGEGELYFWVGEWYDPDGPGGADPDLSFFYLDDPLSVETTWTSNILNVNNGNWVTMIDTQGKTAQDLFADPQQWGFGILGGTAAPSGDLAFDSLRVSMVPEPATWCLLLFGGLMLAAGRLVRRR
ncbi:MAG: PEP-CTERM sorting domain-containing protein [Planctomycetia bacterium]